MNYGERILADGVTASNDTYKTHLSNNDLIIGPTGSGKTRSYVLPNLLTSEESFIVVDTKGTLCAQAKPALLARGFRVLELNFSEMYDSPCGYNPLRFIRYDARRKRYNEQDIISLAAAICQIENTKDPGWDYLSRDMLTALIAYVMEFLPISQHHLSKVTELFCKSNDRALSCRFRQAAEEKPDGLAALKWNAIQTCRASDRTYASILCVLSQKLSPFAFDGAQELYTKGKQIDFARISHEPTAVFVKVSDYDTAFRKMTGLFYTQALQSLIREADTRPSGRLSIATRIYLDDFSTLYVPDFEQTISIIRSRDISVSVILQSLSQLSAAYGDANAKTIVNNCDTELYLGGKDVETAKYFAAKANRSVHAVLDMPVDDAMLFTRGEKAREVRLFDLGAHAELFAAAEGEHEPADLAV